MAFLVTFYAQFKRQCCKIVGENLCGVFRQNSWLNLGMFLWTFVVDFVHVVVVMLAIRNGSVEFGGIRKNSLTNSAIRFS